MRDLTYLFNFVYSNQNPRSWRFVKRREGVGVWCVALCVAAYPQPKFILCHEGGCVHTGSEGAGLLTESSDLSHLPRYSVAP